LTNTDDKYLKIQKVMSILDCTDRHVYDLVASKDLIAIRIGTQAKRISEKSLNDYIERNKINPDDLLDPDNENVQPASPSNKPVAKSNWMRK